jgi:hypothetical protein
MLLKTTNSFSHHSHWSVHRNQGLYQCEMCINEFSDLKLLKEHLRSIYNPIWFVTCVETISKLMGCFISTISLCMNQRFLNNARVVFSGRSLTLMLLKTGWDWKRKQQEWKWNRFIGRKLQKSSSMNLLHVIQFIVLTTQHRFYLFTCAVVWKLLFPLLGVFSF